MLEEVAAHYPAEMVAGQRRDIPRIAFHIQTAIKVAPTKPLKELTICDLGGGVGLFSVGCAAVGFGNVVLVDDFGDAINAQIGMSVIDLHKRYGVHVLSRDIVAVGMDGLSNQLDVVTCFDSMEHWHNSPKALFHDVSTRLIGGGCFFLGVPHCVNLRKRITVPLGYGRWSTLSDWYDVPVFRGHVREPDVGDLRYIANDMGLENVKVFGRNWLAYASPSGAIRIASNVVDYPLRLFPSLCSDIYMCAWKPRAAK
jgi:SAM-dependent methyltransferase